ncbi:hypothetical protein [Gimesia sp.]|uniref:hypothetical protein n=1 Tax=Gimesia sp. TaxID=2024833 RepID=UPI003A94C281
MIWDFADGVIWRTAFVIHGYHADFSEMVASVVINEFDQVQQYENDPFTEYLELHLKIAAYIEKKTGRNPVERVSETPFYRSAERRVRLWGKGILLGMNYNNVEIRIVVSKLDISILIAHEIDDIQIPKNIAQKMADILGGEYHQVNNVSDISWYTNEEWK